MKKFFKHLHTITKHRFMVMGLCFRAGLYRQGLVHDLSKYGICEFWAGVKYYQGYRSPQEKEREVKGYSAAWLHHKGKNKHHYDYWTEYSNHKWIHAQMPRKYLAESVCDRIAASKIYLKKSYTNASPLEYLLSKGSEHMNENTFYELKYFLTYLSEHGERSTLKLLKKWVRRKVEIPPDEAQPSLA